MYVVNLNKFVYFNTQQNYQLFLKVNAQKEIFYYYLIVHFLQNQNFSDNNELRI